MKKLLLHIGRHKSGSTSVQHFLAANAIELAKQGICYPHTGRGSDRADRTDADNNAHHRLANLFILGEWCSLEHRKALRDSFINETKPFHTVILSSEAFQNVDNFRVMRDFFDEFYIETIAYLREYASYVISAYAQEVKASELCDDILNFERSFGLRLDQFVWSWSLFANKSHWRLYEREFMKDQDVVSDFMQSAGLDFLESPRSVNDNISWSGNLLGFKRIANVCGLHHLIDRRALDKIAASTRRFAGTVRVKEETLARWRAGNNCNEVLYSLFGSLPLRDFSSSDQMLNWETFDADVAHFLSVHDPQAAAVIAARLRIKGTI